MARSVPLPSLAPIPRNGITGPRGILLHLLVWLAAAVPPLGIAFAFRGGTYLPRIAVEAISAIVLVLITIYIFRTAQTARGVILILLACAALPLMLFASVIPGAVLISLLFVTSEGALLVATTTKRGLAILPILPIGAFALSVALCGHLHAGVLSLLPFPAAVMLGLGTRSSAAKANGLTRVGVICATTLVTGLSVISVGLYFLYLYMGTMDFAVLAPEFESFRDTLITLLAERAAEASSAYAEVMTEAYFEELIQWVFNLLPGYTVSGLLIYTAFAQMLLFSSLHTVGYGSSVTDRVRDYRISPVTDVVFVLTYLVMVTTVINDSSLVGLVAFNLVIILQPGLALGGLLRIIKRLTGHDARSGCAPLILFIIPSLLLIMPTALAGYESIAGLISAIREHRQPPDDIHPTNDRGSHTDD